MNFGYDPEFFMFDMKKGKIVSAADVLQNGKADKKARLHLRGTGHSVYRDGYVAELNTSRVEACRGLLFSDLCAAITQMAKVLPDHRLVPTPAARVSIAELSTQPQDVLEFGCSPSLNAYEEKQLLKMPRNAATHPWRYAGGHMHLSAFQAAANREEVLHEAVRFLDYWLGLPLTAVFDRPEQYQRRKYYGRAGEWRNKGAGKGFTYIEYRTPGPEIFARMGFVSFAFGVARSVLYNFQRLRDLYPDDRRDDIRKAIDTGKGVWDLVPEKFGLYYTKRDIELMAAIPDKFEFVMGSLGQPRDGHVGWEALRRKLRAGAKGPRP